ncbi:MAG: phage portal protein family protein [Chthonomonadales bacterium]
MSASASVPSQPQPSAQPGLHERLHEEIAAWDAVFRTVFRMPPYNPDELLTRRGIDLYDRMMTDAQVRASINTKRYALLARPWQIFPAVRRRHDRDFRAAMQARDFVEDVLRGLRGPEGSPQDFRRVLFQMMSAFYRGFSVAEMVWRLEDAGPWAGKYVLAAIKFKNPKQIGFDVDEFLNVRAVTSFTPEYGLVTVPRGKCLIYVYNARDELPYGESDLRAVYKHWYSKNRIMEFWNLRLQRFGIPFAYANAPNPSDANGARILEILRGLQQEASAVFPQSVRPQLIEARSTGDDAFLSALEWHNQQIAIGILLQTLTSGEGRRTGSMALGRVHFDILLFALECMKQDIEAAVNAQIIRPLIDANFSHQLYPQLSLGNLDEKDLLRVAQAMNVLLTHKVVDAREPILRELFNLPPLEEQP